MTNDNGLDFAETMRDRQEPPEPLTDFLPESEDDEEDDYAVTL
jgi:hypothetical protein